MLIPHPLKIRVVEPTLLEWTVVELDPADQIALREFVVCLLSQVNYATHELPVGYLGSALKDLDTLNRVEVLLPRISSDKDHTAYAAEVAEQKALIHEYLRKHP